MFMGMDSLNIPKTPPPDSAFQNPGTGIYQQFCPIPLKFLSLHKQHKLWTGTGFGQTEFVQSPRGWGSQKLPELNPSSRCQMHPFFTAFFSQLAFKETSQHFLCRA